MHIGSRLSKESSPQRQKANLAKDEEGTKHTLPMIHFSVFSGRCFLGISCWSKQQNIRRRNAQCLC